MSRETTSNDGPVVRSRLMLSFAGIAFGVGVLAIGELGARLLGPPGDPEMERYASEALRMSFSCHPSSALGERDSNSLRLAIVGESSGEFLTAAALEQESGRLPGPGLRLKVAACAQSASSLEQIEKRFNEVVAADPDAVAILAGHNLPAYFPTEPAAIARLWLGAHSRLVSLLAPPRKLTFNLDDRRARLEQFLRRAAQVARERHFRLVITTMAPNYWIPMSSPGTPSRGTNVVEYWKEVLEARVLRYMGKPEEARTELLKLASLVNVPYAWFELGIWERMDGRLAESRKALDQALDMAPVGRASRATNDVIRRVAVDENVLLYDAVADAEARSGDGLQGWETIRDNCHLTRDRLFAEATGIRRLLGDTSSLPSAPPEDVNSYVPVFVAAMDRTQQRLTTFLGQPEVDAALALAFWRLLLTQGEAAQNQLRTIDSHVAEMALAADVQARMLAGAAAAEFLAGDLVTARRLGTIACTQGASPSALACTQLGLLELRENRPDEARAWFDRALALDPNGMEAMVDRSALAARN